MKFKIDIKMFPEAGEEEIARDVSVLVETIKDVAVQQLNEAVDEIKALRSAGRWKGLNN